MESQQNISIIKPDDWHLHIRDEDIMRAVLAHTTENFSRAIIMPNLNPPVVTKHDAIKYRNRIISAIPDVDSFTPLMTLYLTDNTNAEDLRNSFKEGVVVAAKLYPAGATTNSESGVTDVKTIYPLLSAMEEIGMPLLIHGEVVKDDVDVFDRENVFIEKILSPLRDNFPCLKIVLEHVTTSAGVDFVKSQDRYTAATITPHHLVINRNSMFKGGIRPHFYCLPVAKREKHRLALVNAATSGDKRFFLGTDSAPHFNSAKESSCGCAGIFNVPIALPILAHVFEEEEKLNNLERFCSLNGPEFYGFDTNSETITLEKKSSPVEFESHIDIRAERIKIFDPGLSLYWHVV